MSDTPQGPGWWQASDGKWYPPEQAPGYQAEGGYQTAGGGGYAGTGGTDIGSVLSYSWNKFTQSIGEWIVLWLIMIGIAIVAAILTVVVVAGSSATSGFTGFRFNFGSIVIGTLAGAVSGVLMVALAKAGVMTVNGQKIDIGACFKLTGNNIVAGVVFGVIYGFLNSLCGLFGIVAFLLLGFLPILSAMDDKGAEALGESINLSTSRPGEAMGFWAVAWLISACLCFLGAPIAVIGGSYLVKRFRGEPVAP
ncbi:MAG: hypothetical protein N2037_09345 [Acidimicrobiales bacterium]|nr:hypothetical protein [Acidimicrobiales bacterium]